MKYKNNYTVNSIALLVLLKNGNSYTVGESDCKLSFV